MKKATWLIKVLINLYSHIIYETSPLHSVADYGTFRSACHLDSEEMPPAGIDRSPAERGRISSPLLYTQQFHLKHPGHELLPSNTSAGFSFH